MFARFMILATLFFAVTTSAGPLYGDVDSTQTLFQRVRFGLWVPQMSPPYTWCDTVNMVAEGDSVWTCPDSAIVCEIRFRHPGTYKMQLTRSGTINYYADSLDIKRDCLYRMRRNGTDTAGWSGVTVWGFIEQ
jgi:hypothetical protein